MRKGQAAMEGPGRRNGSGRRLAAAVVSVAAVSLAIAGCGKSGGGSTHTASCPAHPVVGGTPPASGTAGSAAASPGSAGSGGTAGVAAGWTLPDGNLASTRDVASGITSSNVAKLGVAWTAPIGSKAEYDNYYATPIVVDGVVYSQDVRSNVIAIQLSTGKVLWRHNYNSIDGGPNGVNVVGGTVYAATATSAVALSAATGRQLWSRTLVHNPNEEIDMAPGYNRGTVYLSTAPVSVHSEYAGGARSALWALNASTGAPEWSWDEVQNLWGNPHVNSGGGQWYAPSFDAQGNIYLGVANPGPLGGAPGYPWGTSRPGPDLYTDSVVKLSPAGKLLWYYQLTPHDLFDWDLQDPPVLSTAGGHPVVIDGGKAGILFELNAQTGKPLWTLPVGVHNGHDHDGLLTEYAKPHSHLRLSGSFCLEPGPFGGIETQLASNGSTTFAAVNDMPLVATSIKGYTVSGGAKGFTAAIEHATGEMVAVSQATGKTVWDDRLPSSPYGAATVTNDVVFTTTYGGYLYAFSTASGAVLLKTPMSAGSNAPVAVDGDYVIASAGVASSAHDKPLIIAYKLGAHGTLPATVNG
jgi:outer membrane protein assembly factor BamB